MTLDSPNLSAPSWEMIGRIPLHPNIAESAVARSGNVTREYTAESAALRTKINKIRKKKKISPGESKAYILCLVRDAKRTTITNTPLRLRTVRLLVHHVE